MSKFDLTKAELKQKAELTVKLEAMKIAIAGALELYNNECSTAFGHLEAEVNKFNEALEEARGFAQDIANERQSEFDDRSERWQEGDAAQEAQEFISAWEDVELPDIELSEPDELSLEIEQPETFANLAEQVGS